MVNVTYTVLPAAGSNGSRENDSSSLRPACSDVFPSTAVYYEDLKVNYGEAILVGVCCLLTLLCWILYCFQLRSRFYKFKDAGKRFKILALLGLYPMTSLMASFSLLVPRSTILVDLVASCYLSMCIYLFITLIFHYFGGKAYMIEAMSPHMVSIRTPPCCCCCCCFPDLKFNKINVRKFEVLTMQIAVVVPFVLFIKAVLWTDDVRVLQGVNPNQALFYIILVTVVSTLLAMYGLVVMVKATEQILQKHRIRMKFLVLQLVLIFTNLQSAIISIFYRFDLPPCRGIIGTKVRGSGFHYGLIASSLCFFSFGVFGGCRRIMGTKVRGSVIQHMMLCFEMFLLAACASRAYRKSEHRDLPETCLTEASEPTFYPQRYGTVATSTDDLHKYIPGEPGEPTCTAETTLLPKNGSVSMDNE